MEKTQLGIGSWDQTRDIPNAMPELYHWSPLFEELQFYL